MKAVKVLLLPFGCLSRHQGQSYGTKSLLTILLFLAVYLPGKFFSIEMGFLKSNNILFQISMDFAPKLRIQLN